MDPVQDNPATGTPGDSTGANLETIMSGMTAAAKPEAKPDASVEGKKDEGSSKDQQAPELPAWTSQLPDELKNNSDVMKQLSKFGKIGELAKSYSELEGKIGRSLVKPADDASDEEKNAFYKKLGRPDSADGYSINDKESKAFRDLAWKNNLTDAQVKGIYASLKEVNDQLVNQQKQALQAKVNETEAKLKAEYGNAYADKLKMLQRGIQTYGGAELGNKLKASGLLFDADVVKMFVLLGEQSAEAGSTTKGTGTQKQYVSTAEGGGFTFKGL